MIRYVDKAAMCITLAAACQLSGAQVTKQGTGYLMRMKFTPGQTLKYSMTSGAKLIKDSMTVVIPIVMSVKSVQGNIATISLKSGPMVVNGAPQAHDPQVAVVKLDNRGRPAGGGQALQVAAELPERPIKIGEEFTTFKSVTIGTQQLKVTSVNRLTAIKKVGDRTVAVVEERRIGSGAMQIKGTGTTLLDFVDGSIISMKSQMAMVVGEGKDAQTIVNTLSIVRKQ
jgi:hypothetical protein